MKTMPIYFFDIKSGDATTSSGDGVAFPSDEFAREYAVGIASTFALRRTIGAPDRVSIRDETGTQVDEVSRADLAE